MTDRLHATKSDLPNGYQFGDAAPHVIEYAMNTSGMTEEAIEAVHAEVAAAESCPHCRPRALCGKHFLPAWDRALSTVRFDQDRDLGDETT